MKYENAKDILPESLLKQVQLYAEGKVIYIPKRGNAKGWGEASGCREKLDRRNTLIRSRYASGRSVLEIAEEFYLSPETVKKLVYGKKVNLPAFSPSAASAEQYARAGMGEEWVRIWLSSVGAEMPDDREFFLSELVKIPLRLISVEGAPEMNPGAGSASGVPLIVFYERHRFTVPYQQACLSELKREKRNSHPAFIFARHEEYGVYMNNYGKHFLR